MSDIFSNHGTSFQYVEPDSGKSASWFQYLYQVPLDSSHYLIRAGRDWKPTSYDGAIWVDPSSFEVKRLRVRTGELPAATNSCEATTTVDYQTMKVGLDKTLIPLSSVLHFLMRDGSETESATTYSDCHEFHGESTIHFEDMPTESVGSKRTGDEAVVPVGVSLLLGLETPIDTDVAAAGDMITAKVRKAVLIGNSKVAIPRDTVVHGRLTLMQHWSGPVPHFEIAILLESIDLNGTSIPLYAKLDRTEEIALSRRAYAAGLGRRSIDIWLPPAGQSPMVGRFVFPSSKKRYVVQRGYSMRWLTLPAPGAPVP